MEAPERIFEHRGVLRDRCRDPRMRELHQERLARAEEHNGLAINLPNL